MITIEEILQLAFNLTRRAELSEKQLQELSAQNEKLKQEIESLKPKKSKL